METEPNRWKIPILIALALLVLFALYGWPGLWRYQYFHDEGYYRMDRITGVLYRYDRRNHWKKL